MRAPRQRVGAGGSPAPRVPGSPRRGYTAGFFFSSSASCSLSHTSRCFASSALSDSHCLQGRGARGQRGHLAGLPGGRGQGQGQGWRGSGAPGLAQRLGLPCPAVDVFGHGRGFLGQLLHLLHQRLLLLGVVSPCKNEPGGTGATRPLGCAPPCCPPAPRPLLLQPPGPYLLPAPGRPCRRAGTAGTPSWLGREQSAGCGAARGSRARPLPSTTLTRDVPTHLRRAL